jgi:bilirubin oxidase
MITRRVFIKLNAAGAANLALASCGVFQSDTSVPEAHLQPSPALDAASIAKYQAALVIPPAMPQAPGGGADLDYYEIALRQFAQQVLPPGMPKTTVWSYGAYNRPETFNYPAFTIEARHNRPLRVKWINELIDGDGRYLPHLLAVDQTLHWANPPGGEAMRDHDGMDPRAYTGPVPMVVHVHGAHADQESDGYSQAWFLPAAVNVPAGYATTGTWYAKFKDIFRQKWGVDWEPGTAVFQYANRQRAGTLWYHDHTLGITRLNVYAGPAGFYLLRGGPDDLATGLPGPPPGAADPPGTRYYEIPLAIQDRSFRVDGSLSYPDNRAFFEGLKPEQLQIPFRPDPVRYPNGTTSGPSDVAPIWNPEFFGEAMLVNGCTWPKLEVEPRRYRFRVLNGCNSRFLILRLVSGTPTVRPIPSAVPFWQIGAEGSFLPAAVKRDSLLMAPAERADVIVDFTGLAEGTELYLINEGPDEPLAGGTPGVDFDVADPDTTGQVLKLIVGKLVAADTSLPPDQLVLPAYVPLGAADVIRQVSLNEAESETVKVRHVADGTIVLDPAGEPFGPTEALLGTVDPSGEGKAISWDDAITETPLQDSTEIWEIHNFTVDAHPIHIHQVMFEVVNRQPLDGGARAPEHWELAAKDTVIAYPGEITRVKAKFDLPGRYVWHCHIVEHEDNEMMRPIDVLPR